MARLGAWDAELRALALFDAWLVPEGWVSADLIDAEASSASLTPALGGVVLVPVLPGRVLGTVLEPLTP